MSIDFLIVGQGLAGTTLALELMQRGLKVHVLASGTRPGASQTAAGIYNPVTGNRMVKTWQADELFANIEEYYRQQELLLGARFLHPVGIYRPFTTRDEQNDWTAKTADQAFAPYIRAVSGSAHPSGAFHDPFGGVYLCKAGFIDTKIFLDASKNYLKKAGVFSEGLFDESLLVIENQCVKYGELTARAIVLCHGLGACEGKLFSWLPFHRLKGEILKIEATIQADIVFNRGCFMLPESKNIWKVGSTYDWKNPDTGPSEQGKLEILQKLRHLYKGSATVATHHAGIRPSTKDRRPFLGRHPEAGGVYIFNGLGTKGVSLAPFLAKQMANYLAGSGKLPGGSNIERYFFLYFERIAG